jgi:hypothetical protein
MTIYVPGKLTFRKQTVSADPYYNNVSLLLHGDGVNGSTTIVDSSPSPKIVTAVGNAQIGTAQSKFGGASIAFDGAGDYLQSPSNSGFQIGTGDFTLEAWIHPLAFASEPNFNDFGSIFDFRTAGVSQVNILLTFLGSSNLVFFVDGLTRITGAAISVNQWTHVALCKSSGTTRLFINGAQSGVNYSDANNYTSSAFRIAGNVSANAFFHGYIDDVRITKGIARYQSAFTPPTAPFPEVLG